MIAGRWGASTGRSGSVNSPCSRPRPGPGPPGPPGIPGIPGVAGMPGARPPGRRPAARQARARAAPPGGLRMPGARAARPGRAGGPGGRPAARRGGGLVGELLEPGRELGQARRDRLGRVVAWRYSRSPGTAWRVARTSSPAAAPLPPAPPSPPRARPRRRRASARSGSSAGRTTAPAPRAGGGASCRRPPDLLELEGDRRGPSPRLGGGAAAGAGPPGIPGPPGCRVRVGRGHAQEHRREAAEALVGGDHQRVEAPADAFGSSISATTVPGDLRHAEQPGRVEGRGLRRVRRLRRRAM